MPRTNIAPLTDAELARLKADPAAARRALYGWRSFDSIGPGDRVTIVTPQGQERTGRAVMRGPYGWVLDMGGRHGTPGIASKRNTVRVVKARKKK